MRRFAAFLLFCLYPGVADAAPEESLRVYSDICFNVEGGDALGVRIGVITLGNGPYAFLQWSEGYPEDNPKMAKVSAADFKRGKLVFSVLRDSELTTFRGTMTAKDLIGTFSPKWPGDPTEFHLRRVPPQQRFPDCVAPK